MRRLFLILLLTLAAAASLAWLVRIDTGYVLIQFHGTSVETSVWFALAVLGVTLVAFYYLARLLLLVVRATGWLRGVRATRAPRRSPRSAQARGAVAWAEGRWQAAARLLAAGARRSEAPLLNHLLAARAAAAGGDVELARGFLALAEGIPGARTAIAIERARLQLGTGDAAAALASLDGIPGDPCPAAVDLLLDVLAACGEWQRLIGQVASAREIGLRATHVLDALERRALDSLLSSGGKRADALRESWKSLPAATRATPALIARQAQALHVAGADADATKLLEAGLAARWDPALVRTLGLVRHADAVHQLARMEKLLPKHPGDVELLLALGRVALAGGLWGKARDYLESSLARDARAETCVELARACEKLGEADKARRLRDRALELGFPSARA